jgi:hypothetical protein
MKHKRLVIATTIFFLLVNTSYFWEGQLGLFAFPIMLLLIVFYIVLAFVFLQQVVFLFKEKFSDRQRVAASLALLLVLTLASFKPAGIVDFDKLSGNDLLVAGREGSANCTTKFKLKDNNKFIESSICFGVTDVRGSYEVRGDTIFFKNVSLGRHTDEYYMYALIKPAEFQNKKIIGALVRYRDKTDKEGHELFITKNELSNPTAKSRTPNSGFGF